jgi:hypothetical protein
VKRQLERLKKPANKFQMIVTKNDFKNVRIPEASDEEKEAIIKKQKQWITSLRKSIKEREESCKGESA